MRKIFTLFCFVFLVGQSAFSQQDPMFTKYMFNSLNYNPAYAGAKDHLALGLLYRNQWWGIDGGPVTQTFTIHTPLRNERVGVGLSAYNDVIGPTQQMGANLSYAYRIPLGKGKLSVGLQGGVTNWRADFSKLTLASSTQDEAFEEVTPSYWLPNFGAGIYYYTKRFYVGFASPHLIEYDLRTSATTEIWAKQYRHYFASIGGAIPIKGDMLVFKPSLLVKNVGLLSSFNKDDAFKEIGAPTEVDVDLSFLFYEALWIGGSFRTAIEAFNGTSSFDSADLWIAYYLQNGLRIGAAYDYSLTKIQNPAKGSFELMLGYEFNYKTKQIVTPRYF
ncbi:MAG TPA: type IX secretion system membrane protein PorP/SprF [Phaeodactylibacter sp.]|nr:type IX secretion system membrane protein PorP/SprF [Phaeodactylibacter sp.]